MLDFSEIRKIDGAVADAIVAELERQQHNIELIACSLVVSTNSSSIQLACFHIFEAICQDIQAVADMQTFHETYASVFTKLIQFVSIFCA